MDFKKNVGPLRDLTTNTSTSSGEATTVQHHVVRTTLQTFVWSLSDQVMNLSHPEDVFSLETATAESMNDSTQGVFMTDDSTSANVNLTSAVPPGGQNGEPSVRIMVYTILHAVVILVGLLTNALTLMVMMRSNIRKQQMAVFLIPLAVFDVIKLITDIHLAGLIHFIPNSFDISTYSTLSCQIVGATALGSSCISSWILVVMTAERAMAVHDPIRFKTNWSKKMSIRMVLTPILVITTLSVFAGWTNEVWMDPVSGLPLCWVIQDTTSLIVGIIDALVYSIVPSIALFILNMIILRGLYAEKDISVSSVHQGLNRQERLLVITVLCISISFLLSVLPFGIYQIYYLTPTAEKDNHIWFEIILLSSLNHSFNFVFYIIGGRRFRTEFINMMCCICRIVKNKRNS